MAHFKYAEEDKRIGEKNIYYKNKDAVEKVLCYITRTNLDPARGKEPPLYVGALGAPLDIMGMIDAFYAVKIRQNNMNGRQVYHMILGFNQVEEALLMSSGMVDSYAYQVAYYFFNMGYQTVYAVHRNQKNLHIHIVINSVSHKDGRKYQTDFGAGKRELEEYFNWMLWGYIHQPMQPVAPVKYQTGCIGDIPKYQNGMPPICPIEFFDLEDVLEYGGRWYCKST